MAGQAPREATAGELLRIRNGQWAGRLRGCSLVAELEVNEEHARQVARVLGRVYAKYEGTPRAERMFVTWPACVVIALTAIAGRDYQHGELWPEIWAGLGYQGDPNHQTTWGRGFLIGLVMFDTVSGGAGGVLRIAETLDEVVEAALARVSDCDCDCGEETSCYGCLRSFGNQRFHEDLSRGGALRTLHSLQADGGLVRGVE